MKYLKTKFAKFHYNAVFPRMKGKLSNSINNNPNSILGKKTDSKDSDFENIFNDDKKMEEETNKKEEVERKKRLKKARSLRRILVKKAKEKKEILKNAFFRFYRIVIFARFRSEKMKRTFVPNKQNSKEIFEKILSNQNSGKLNSIEAKEKEDLKSKIIEIVKRIVYKADRRKRIIMKRIFRKFYLIKKLESINNILDSYQAKGKKKKKKKKKIINNIQEIKEKNN